VEGDGSRRALGNLRSGCGKSSPPVTERRVRCAVEALCRDWERRVTFYRFPKDHRTHLRTTNPVESPLAAVRLGTDAAKRYKNVANAEALIWKILRSAEKKFRRLNFPKSTRGRSPRTSIRGWNRRGGIPPDVSRRLISFTHRLT
jgi:hypothetical protein